jgi:hypothetical protein
MKLVTVLTALTLFGFSAYAKVHTTPAEIADVVTSFDSLSKKIVGLNSVSLQKFVVSKVNVTQTANHEDIGFCVYEYTAYLSNADSEVKSALNGHDFFSGKQNFSGKCRF